MCLAVPGQIRSIAGDGLERSARAAFGSLTKEISLAFTPEAGVDDYVLVHAGVAIAVIDAEEAERTLALLAAAGEEESAA